MAEQAWMYPHGECSEEIRALHSDITELKAALEEMVRAHSLQGQMIGASPSLRRINAVKRAREVLAKFGIDARK